ncbi:hypothetical protein RB195_016918 [Necator americanus]|uniref:Flavin-containing monooxygenase n=1 Tax=Necator americanus TaxID=51031 RepID=A0ABR1C2R8_NECAM
MTTPNKTGTACVIGAGVSGLTAIKHLLEYGIEVVCFEKSQHIGGLWRYNDGNREGYGSVMKNTILNTSKEFVTFSDFDMDPTLPNFMPNHLFYAYLLGYAEHFDLAKHICFGTAVKSDFTKFIDRNVLVVGLGNSGGDIACELARVAKQVYCSTRHGTWANRRVVNQGYPRDVIMRTRYFEKLQKFLPARLRSYLSLREYNNFMDHKLYGLRPQELPGQSPVLLADDLPLHLSSGFIKIRPCVSRFTASSAYFDDGRSAEIDDVIFCTGYNFDFGFIEKGEVVEAVDNQVHLWKRIFPPRLKWNSLAVIGLVDPLGPTTTICEMQTRTVAHMWAKKADCPSEDEMLEEILAEKKATAARYRCSARKASLQVDFIAYMDQLALLAGCMPPLHWKLWLQDPKLAFMLHFGPVTPLHYRSDGYRNRRGTREKILETFDRVHLAMDPNNNHTSNAPLILLLCNSYSLSVCALIFSFFVLILLF